MHRNKISHFKIAFIAAALLACGALSASAADSPSDIQARINDNNQKIADLQKQINQYSTLLNSTSLQAQTLTNALAQLELTRKKLEANLALTTKEISKTGLTLNQLSSDISDTQAKIDKSSAAIAETMRQIDQTESQSVIEEMLKNESISDTWDYVNAVHTLQTKIKGKVDDLKDLYADLSVKKDQATGEKTKLESYKKTLSNQQNVVIVAKQAKDKLLADTKSKAAIYNANLAAAIAQREVYEKELFDYESQLKLTVNPGSIPGANHGILMWPLDSVRITQYFGKTVSARRLYVSGTHGGIDLAASIGTPVKAALSGTITDTEPTKAKAGCQYGKYVLIAHPDGLSSIYGHLSLVTVKPGDSVNTGDIIGYSGATGYATGPHLHFGLYVSSAVQIVNSSALGSTACAGIKTVAAPPAAYLDPMAYLPTL